MKRVAVIVGVLVVVLLVMAMTLPLFVSTNTFLPILQQRLSATLGRKVTIGNLSLNIFKGGMVADNLVIADDPAFSTQPFLQAKQLHVGVNLGLLLFHKQLDVTKLDIINPDMQLLQAANGRWNYSSLGTTGAAAGPAGNTQSTPQSNSQPEIFSVDSIHIQNGRATVGTAPPVGPSRVYSGIDLSVSHFSFTTQFPFQLAARLPADGTVKLTGAAGPMNPSDSALTPFHAKLTMQHIDPVAAGFLDEQAGISGLLDVSAKMASDAVTVTSSGDVVGNRMLFSAQGKPASTPMKLTYSTTYNLASKIGNISRATIMAGPVTANLNGTYQLLPGHPQIELQLDGRDLSLNALQALLPAFGVTLPHGSVLHGGALSTTLAIDGPMNDLVITGPVDVRNTQLAGYDLGSKLSAISALNSLGGGTGNVTDIQTFRADLKDTPQVIAITNILAVVPALGQATGSGTILPGGQLNFNLLAKLSGKGGLGAVATSVMSVLPGIFSQRVATDGIPLTVRGTTSSPVFNVDASVFASGNPANSGQPSKPNTLGNALQGLFGAH